MFTPSAGPVQVLSGSTPSGGQRLNAIEEKPGLGAAQACTLGSLSSCATQPADPDSTASREFSWMSRSWPSFSPYLIIRIRSILPGSPQKYSLGVRIVVPLGSRSSSEAIT